MKHSWVIAFPSSSLIKRLSDGAPLLDAIHVLSLTGALAAGRSFALILDVVVAAAVYLVLAAVPGLSGASAAAGLHGAARGAIDCDFGEDCPLSGAPRAFSLSGVLAAVHLFLVAVIAALVCLVSVALIGSSRVLAAARWQGTARGVHDGDSREDRPASGPVLRSSGGP